MCIAQMADILGTGMVAGSFLMGNFAVHPAADRLAASAHVLLRQEMIRRLSRWMPPLMFLPVFAVIAAMTVCRLSVLWMLDVLGLVFSLATIAITVTINAPLNRKFARWSTDTLPEDWQSWVSRWNVAHSARTTTALVAFLCAILGTG
jgi:uncharacterized membrane protein